MKIAVIGTSNSVMAGGYVKALSAVHEVTNLSSGRVPFYAHVKTILRNRASLGMFDIIIIDHYINDVNFYCERLGSEYTDRLIDFYSLLASLNIPVINLLFPISNLSQLSSITYYEKVKNISKRFNFNTLDLNQIRFNKAMYEDSIHLKKEVSYFIGFWLSKELISAELTLPLRLESRESVFSLLAEDYLRCQSGLEEYLFENSLMKLACFVLKEPLLLPEGDRLVSIGYLNPKGSSYLRGISVNGETHAFFGDLYFHEAISVPNGRLILEPLFGQKSEAFYLQGRGANSGHVAGVFDYPTITEFLFHDGSVCSDDSPSGHGGCIDLRQLEGDVLSIFSGFIKTVPDETVDLLRDLAIEKEFENVDASLKLMEVAALFRPNGPLIQRKLVEYRENIEGDKNAVN